MMMAPIMALAWVIQGNLVHGLTIDAVN